MKSRLLTTIAALCLCFSVMFVTRSANRSSTSDWPQWRGPERNGISQERGLLKQWPAEGPKLLWQVNDIGDGYSTPSVVGTRIYLMSNRGMENEFVQALSTQDGKPIWTTRVGNVGNPSGLSLTRRPGPLRPLTETSSTRWARTVTSPASKPGAARFDGRRASVKSSAASRAMGLCRVSVG